MLRSVQKPERKTTDYKEKAIAMAGKIACLDKRCQLCGRGEVYPHHIIHRKYGNTCALVKNLFPVCVVCHSKIHHSEGEFKKLLEKRSPGLYDELWQTARGICRIDFEDVYAALLVQYYNLLVEMELHESAV